MGWPKGKPRGPRKPKEKRDIPPSQQVIASKADRPPVDLKNILTIIFQDGERLEIESGTVPRVVEAGLLFFIDRDGNAQHIPIANNIKRFFWKMRKDGRGDV